MIDENGSVILTRGGDHPVRRSDRPGTEPVRAQVEAAITAVESLRDRADQENRSLTQEEGAQYDRWLDIFERGVSRLSDADPKGTDDFLRPMRRRLEALEDWASSTREAKPAAVRPTIKSASPQPFHRSRIITSGRREDLKYRNLFGDPAPTEWASAGEFITAVMSGGGDQRLSRAMSEGSGSAGGFGIPEQWAAQWIDAALDAEKLRPLCTNFVMNGPTLRAPAWVCDHNTDGLFGGLVTYWVEEGAAITTSEPKVRQVVFNAKKLGILTLMSNELTEDLPSEDQLAGAFVTAMANRIDNAIVNGTGGGQPTGILNSDALITQAAEGGQSADTILWENILGMWNSLSPMSAERDSTVWLINPKAKAEIYSMYQNVGTGGSTMFIAGGAAPDAPGQTLLGKKIIWTSACSALGDVGDIILADLSRMGCAIRRQITLDKSQHAAFTSDSTYYRLTARLDCQPLDNETTKDPDGDETSAFVTLAARD